MISMSDIRSVIMALYFVIIAAAVIVIVHDLRDPVKALSWILVITLLPVVGIVFYMVFGRNYRKEKIFNRKEIDDFEQIGRLCRVQLRELVDPDIQHIEPIEANKDIITLLLNNNRALLTVRNKVKILNDGKAKFEELFEARKPKNAAIISHVSGVANFRLDHKGANTVNVTSEDGEVFTKIVPFDYKIIVQEGQYVEKGQLITEGSVEPGEVLAVSGELAVQDYLIKEVQRVYRTQGVDINDKHIEVIVRQMMRKVRIDDGGDTKLITGSLIDKSELREANEELLALEAQDGIHRKPATSHAVLMGITKASLATDSFMSAASFQETTRVLTEAAIKGKVDPLSGLKENAIIGKLIPAGTGIIEYIEPEKEEEPEEPIVEAEGSDAIVEAPEEEQQEAAAL